ncbi:alpha/beta hydrolase [Actinomadura barringtoniae]|uniref:Alpha/beta hydrolase n=1 Tax=Actinomadura barringtoniae TaxID=1427535 RepID=A0A939PJM5_9ACTN|nr:alpha/beta hydrolase [Actinomadura barringtoniae]MBO2453870.1 alpha/beta hydrolase [Actinomadura barringtoniae]
MRTEVRPPLGRNYDVDGLRLWAHKSGGGTPAVVFLPGAGAVGMDYLRLQEGAAGLATSVIYDRAGTGWSERVDLPRTSTQATDELRAMLGVMDVPGPYVLVGHSLGGLYARHYAQRFPSEVSGLVMLDPAHEDYQAYMPKELVERWEAWDADDAFPDELPDEVVQFYRGLFGAELRDWPEETREPLVDGHVSESWLRVGFDEAKNVEELYDEVRGAGPLPDVPLIVLSSSEVDPFKQAVSQGIPEEALRQEIEGKNRLYTAFAQTVPRGEMRPVEGAGHVTITYRGTGAVLQAIRDVLGNS